MLNYKVLDTFPIGQNTSVTIQGNSNGLRNNCVVTTSRMAGGVFVPIFKTRR